MNAPLTQLDETLSALADPARRRVIEALTHGPKRASELAETVSVSRPSMSKHLRTLLDSGLIAEIPTEGDRRARIYRLQREPFAALQIWLGEVEEFWTDQLASFKEHIESRDTSE